MIRSRSRRRPPFLMKKSNSGSLNCNSCPVYSEPAGHILPARLSPLLRMVGPMPSFSPLIATILSAQNSGPFPPLLHLIATIPFAQNPGQLSPLLHLMATIPFAQNSGRPQSLFKFPKIDPPSNSFLNSAIELSLRYLNRGDSAKTS